MNIITPDEFTVRIKECLRRDKIRPIIRAHEEIDALMCNLLEALGYGEGVDLFINEEKFYA